MSAGSTRRKINPAGVILAAGFALAAATGVGSAAEFPTADEIINALKPAAPRLTRGLTTSPPGTARGGEDARFVDSLRNRTSRSFSSAEREKIASLAQTKPSIDLEVNFEFNSATVGSKALPQVKVLGEALSSADLKAATFIVAGHTDAKGSDPFNQGLSERRADAVKRFLSEKYGIDAARLVTVGYGETQLKNATDPFAGENRRVQVINVSGR